MAGKLDSPLYGMFGIRGAHRRRARCPRAARSASTSSASRRIRTASYALKWDGEWQVTYETFRDMGIAYAVGLVLIYLLVVAQFRSYVTPLIIMAPIPLTIIGVMPGHALLGAQFTATSMIGMIALAGIIVRNSILLVDFINLQLAQGVPLRAGGDRRRRAARAKPIVLTGLAAMLGALFILDDPIFNGLAISLIFGILVSTLLTLVVIPVLYYAYRSGGARIRLTRRRRRSLRTWSLCDRSPRHRGMAAANLDPSSLKGDCNDHQNAVRIFAGAFVLISLALGRRGSPLFVSSQLAVVHRLRRRQPVPERFHALLPAGDDSRQARREARGCLSTRAC